MSRFTSWRQLVKDPEWRASWDALPSQLEGGRRTMHRCPCDKRKEAKYAGGIWTCMECHAKDVVMDYVKSPGIREGYNWQGLRGVTEYRKTGRMNNESKRERIKREGLSIGQREGAKV